MLKVTRFPVLDVVRSGEKNNMEIDMGENGRFLFDFMGYDETRRFLVKKMALLHHAAKKESDVASCRELVELRNALAMALHYMYDPEEEDYTSYDEEYEQ